MKKYHLLLLSCLSGLLLSLAWPARGFVPLLFVALVPLLAMEDHLFRNRLDFSRFAVMLYSYPAFFLWNLLTTWWIYNATPFGMFAAVIVNALFMTVAFTVYHIFRRNLGIPWLGVAALVIVYTTWEYLHLDWDLSWSWLNLGNAFGPWHTWVQWYEYTGAFGGTLWVLIINILAYRLARQAMENKPDRRKIMVLFITIALLILVPVTISMFIYNSYKEKSHPVKVVVVQPNLDPYKEQYVLSPEQVIDRTWSLALRKIDSTTDFVICPESAIQENIWEDRFNDSPSIQTIRALIKRYPRMRVIIGASTFKRYLPGEPLSYTVRWSEYNKFWYDAYNASLLIDSTPLIRKYHKSKLVPGVEMMPFPKYLKFLNKYAIDLGGTIGSIGPDPVRRAYLTMPDSITVASCICYESVYGDFFAGFVRNGAQVMFIITNDGWWKDTPGHRQHFMFAPLRAIETRRSIARAANTGISAYINQRGDIQQATVYWKPAVITQAINANDRLTFYVRHGDYIGRICLWLSGALLIISILNAVVDRRRKI